MGSHDASSVTAPEGAASVVEKTAEEDTVAADLDTPKDAPPDTLRNKQSDASREFGS